MGKIVEKTKKKKKGRPSLLDLQKRSLREQQEQNQQQQRKLSEPNPNPNPNPSPNNPNRRSTRRNPNPDVISPEQERIRAGEEEGEEEEEEDDDDESNGRRREKKLKLVLRLPPHQQNQRSSANANASALNSASGGGSDSNSEDENGDAPLKRRKINAVGDRSGLRDGGEGEKLNTASKTIDSLSGKPMESGPRTPLPDKKLLVFILDRLQKKDTYGVYSEPVDPKELPDYHDIIEHPMDFGTVRNKLSSGAYAYLEQFEKDVFLICSNAMRYNASDTIYFRQARTIQELAKKNFENLRQDSDDNEPEPKIVRRGRPPTKNLKKPLGRPPLDRASSEFSSDATLANGGDNTIWSNSYDLRKGSFAEKSGSADLSGRTLNGSRNSEERKSERNDEFPATMSKNFLTKFGKKQFVFDENRRNTYKQFLASVGHEQSVLGTFDGQKKQLMAVGLHTEHGFARSLARFAADLGPIVWKIASKKIERALPAQMMFGPGWVGVKEPPLSWPSIVTPFPAQSLIPQQHISLPKVSSTAIPCISDSKADKFSEKQEPSNNSTSDAHSNRTTSPPSMNVSSSSAVASKSCEPTTRGFDPARELNCESGFNVLRSTPAGVKPVPPLQIHQRPLLNSGMNGFRGSFGFDLASQMAKFVRPSLQVGSFNSETSMRPQTLDVVSRSNSNFVQPTMPVSHSDSEYRTLPEGPSTINSATSLVDSGQDASRVQPQSTLKGLSRHQKIDSVPPDLNVRFQSPGSPSCTQQPDLALQLQL